MASYVDSLLLPGRTNNPVAPGLWFYECNAALNPVTLDDRAYDTTATSPSYTQNQYSYWVIWNVNSADNNAVVSTDPNWQDTWANLRGRLWKDGGINRSLSLPYEGYYQLEFRIATVPHEVHSSDGSPATDSFIFPIRFGIVRDTDASPGTFDPADANHGDPLNQGAVVPYKNYDEAIDYSNIKNPPLRSDKVVCSQTLFVNMRQTRLITGATYRDIQAPVFTGTVHTTAYLKANQQLRFVISSYNTIGGANADLKLTEFLPQMFDMKISYTNGAYVR